MGLKILRIHNTQYIFKIIPSLHMYAYVFFDGTTQIPLIK